MNDIVGTQDQRVGSDVASLGSNQQGQALDSSSPPLRESDSFQKLFIRSFLVFLFIGVTLMFISESRQALGPLKPLYTGDKEVFTKIAKNPFFSVGFFCGGRPMFVPLIHKLAKYDDERVVNWHLIISQLSHVWLAFILFYSFRFGFFGFLSAAAVYCYAMSPEVNSWVRNIRSESVSLSMLSFSLGALILYNRAVSRRFSAHWAQALGCSVILVFGLFALAFTRDNWSYGLPLIAIILLIPCLDRAQYRDLRARRVKYVQLFTVVCLLAVFAASQWTIDYNKRWRFNLTNLIFNRILPFDDVRLRWQEEYGMPYDDTYQKYSEKWASAYNFEIFRRTEFHQWLVNHGKSAYARHLIYDYHTTLVYIFLNYDRLSDDCYLWYAKNSGQSTSLGKFLKGRAVFRLGDFKILVFGFCVAASLFVALLGGREHGPVGLSLFALSVLLPQQIAFVLIADHMEMDRHLIVAILPIRLLVWLLVFAGLAVLASMFYNYNKRRREAMISLSLHSSGPGGESI